MYTILEIRTNTEASTRDLSFGTFDVLTESSSCNEDKWISVPHELFFAHGMECDKQLFDYIEKRDFPTWEATIDDLESIGYSFKAAMLDYINEYVPENFFNIMPTYDPDFDLNYTKHI
jgi:hypothetical protein